MNIFAIFPGQGSQKVAMGYSLTNLQKELFFQADKALGIPLSQYCFEGPIEKLTETAIAQPAILTVSIAAYLSAKDKLGDKLAPTCVAGHSLGEYSALVAAESISFQDAVQLVHKRGKYMQEATPLGTGAMVAVLGKEVAEIEDALSRVNGVAEIANINAPGQVVVAGSKESVQEFCEIMKGSKIIPLNVSAPFHCSLMKPARDNLEKDINAITINKAKIPVICNYKAAPIQEPADIANALINQVCNRVRWVETMKVAVEEFKVEKSIEFGAGNVLNGLLKRMYPDVIRTQVETDKDIESLSL